MTARARELAVFGAVAVALTVVGALSPLPARITDRGIYEATTSLGIVPDCADLQCFRILVPWILGPIPAPSIVKWTGYAVVCNVAASAAVFYLCLTLGFSRRAAWLASMASAFGFGSLYTLHDSFTSDPLMFAVGPLLTNELLKDRVVVAAAIGAVAVLAKEFAAAPLYVFALCEAMQRRWTSALRSMAAGNLAFLVWLTLTLTLMLRFNYSYGYNGNGSADFSHGAALALWLKGISLRGAVFAMFNEFGALYVLAPIGFWLAPRRLRLLCVAALPVAAVFCLAQQPDRALWNFHFLVVPLAGLVLERVPAPLAWATIAAFGIGNLRVGAQLPMAAVSHVAIGVSVALAIISCVAAIKVRSEIGPFDSAQTAPSG